MTFLRAWVRASTVVALGMGRVPQGRDETPSLKSRSILRIIQILPNSKSTEKSMDGENHLQREHTRVMSLVESGLISSSCHAHVAPPGSPHTIEWGALAE
jgi:hypothetical protein